MKNKYLKVFYIVLIVIFSLLFGRNYYRYNMLKNSQNYWAILIKTRPNTARTPKMGVFEYIIDNTTFSFTQSGDYTMLKIGDTVLIEYSVKDKSVAKVIDKYHYQIKKID